MAQSAGAPMQPLALMLVPLFRSVRDAVVLLNVAAGQIALCNPAAEELLGYSALEVTGLRPEQLVPAQLAPFIRGLFAEYHATGDRAILTAERLVELSVLRKDGIEVRVELTASVIAEDAGQPRYLLVIGRDVAERRQIAQLRLERTRLEALLLAARAAHHALYNELGPIVGYAELLTVDPRLPAELRSSADRLLRRAEAAAATLRSLQRTTRPEAPSSGAPLGAVFGDDRSPIDHDESTE